MELHDLKLMLQRHLSDGLVTVVGSGLSCAEGLPGMGELAAHLQATIALGLVGEDRNCWDKLSPLISTKGLEAALLEVAPTSNLEVTIVARTAELIAKREGEVIEQVFAGTKKLRFTRLLPHLLKPPMGLPVITTNYDRLLEIAIEEAGLGVDTMFVGQFAGALNESESRFSFCRDANLRKKQVHFLYRERANVYKPHGSLDWYYRDGRPVRFSGALNSPRLIITPGLNKFRNGYASPFDRHREKANLSIDRASRFLILGYGFNDDHLETHLTPRIKSGIPTLMLTRSLSANAMKLVLECSNVLAVQHAVISGTEGTSVFVGTKEFQYPNLALWELGTFISEVLQP